MNPATQTPPSTFNANMLSRSQKRELERTGSFRTSQGQYRDANGNTVNVPSATNLSPAATAAVNQPMSSPTPATDINPATSPGLPEPQAGAIAENYMGSVAGDVVKYRAVIDANLNTEKTRIDSELKQLKDEEKNILKETGQLTEPFREKLENKERERLYINKNFEDNQKLVEELDSLLTEGNELIRISKGRAVANTVLNQSVNKTMADVQARAGVIQAVMSARSGQIAEAERLIDRSVNAITADRNDQIAYYDTLLSLNNQKLISLDSESKQIATEQRSLAYNDLKQAETTANFVKSLMISPDTAKFMADSGVSLNDNLDTIKTKMSKEATRVELINEAKAYAEVAIGSGYASADELALLNDVTVDTQTKKALAEKVVARSAAEKVAMEKAAHNASMASAMWGNRAKMMDLALGGDPKALAALGWDPRVLDSAADVQEHEIKTLENQSLLSTLSRIKSNESGIKSSTGAVKSAWLQGLFAGPAAGQGSQDRGFLGNLVKFTPVLGNITNAAHAINSKEDLISDVSMLVQNDGFRRYVELKESGVSLTPFTDADRQAIIAAGELGSKIIWDKETGQVTGIRGSEKEFKRALDQYTSKIEGNQDTLNANFLSQDELKLIYGTGY